MMKKLGLLSNMVLGTIYYLPQRPAGQTTGEPFTPVRFHSRNVGRAMQSPKGYHGEMEVEDMTSGQIRHVMVFGTPDATEMSFHDAGLIATLYEKVDM